MIFLDANIFIAFDNEDDVHHQRAREILKDVHEKKFGFYFTSDYVFNEVVGVTTRKYGKEQAVRLGQRILERVFMIAIDDYFLREAWSYFAKTPFNFSLVDCTSITVLKTAGATNIATFDKEFAKLKEVVVIR